MSARFSLRIRPLRLLLLIGLLSVRLLAAQEPTVAEAALAIPSAAEASEAARFPSWLHAPLVGGQFEDDRGTNQRGFYLVQPLWAPLLAAEADSGSLLFFQPEVVWAEGDRWFASLGLGFRHLFAPPSEQEAGKFLGWLLQDGWFFGANVFGDRGKSARGFEYDQLGAGLELGSRWLSFRGNYYWPLSDRRQYASVTTSEVLSRSKSFSEGYDYNITPHPTRTDIVDVNVFWNQNRRARTTTRFTTTDFFEAPQEGWDLEAMALVPGLDRHVDLRLLAGLYDYGQEMRGARFGVELRPVPAVVLSATWFEDAGPMGDHWLAGVGFQIPLGAAPKTQLTPRSRSLKERLLEPVARQSQIQMGDEEETSSEVRETLVSQSNGGSFKGQTEHTVTTTNINPATGTFTTINAFSPGTVISGHRPDGTHVDLEVQSDGSLREISRGKSGLVVVVIPEPGRTLLLALGACSLMLRRRRGWV